MQDTNFRTQKKQILSHQGTFKTPWLPGMGLAGLSGCDSSPRSWMGAAPGRRAPFKASFSSGTFQTPLLSLSPKLSALLNIPRRWHPEPIWYFHLSFVFSLITSLLSSVPGNPPHPGSGTSPLPLPAPPTLTGTSKDTMHIMNHFRVLSVLAGSSTVSVKAGEGLWNRTWSDRIRGNGFPLAEGRDGWDIGKELFPVRVGRPWHRVSREAVAAPGSLEVSKARLEHPGIVEGVPVHGRGWHWMGFNDPSSPNQFGIL